MTSLMVKKRMLDGYRGLLLVVILMALVGDAVAATYTWRDENGVLQFSDRRPLDQPVTSEIKTIEVPEIETVTTRQLPASLWTERQQTARRATRNKNKVSRSIVMYSAKWCGVCQRAKDYFERHNVQYVEKDIDDSASALKEFRTLGGRGVPLIVVGQSKLTGFSPASFEQVYRASR